MGSKTDPAAYLQPWTDQWLSDPQQPSEPAYFYEAKPIVGKRKKLTWTERRVKRKAAKRVRQAIQKNLQARRRAKR